MGRSAVRGPELPDQVSRPTMARWSSVVGTILLVAVAGLMGLYAAIRADLPAQVASHWGSDGVDSTQSPRQYLITTVALLVGLALVQGVVARFIPADGRRVLGVVAAGMTGFLGLGLGGTLWDQRGITDPYAAPSPGGWLALGFALAVPLAGLAWWLLPTYIPDAHVTPGAPPARTSASRLDAARAEEIAARLGPPGTASGETWRDPVPAGRGVLVILGLLAFLAIGLSATPARWIAVPVLVLVAVIVGSMARSEMVVDADAVRVRAYGKVTWLSAPLRTIRFADVEQVRPLAEFGGYGLRYGMRGRGFVTVPGPALHLKIPGSTDTWITCAHPELAAAMVNALLARRAR